MEFSILTVNNFIKCFITGLLTMDIKLNHAMNIAIFSSTKNWKCYLITIDNINSQINFAKKYQFYNLNFRDQLIIMNAN